MIEARIVHLAERHLLCCECVDLMLEFGGDDAECRRIIALANRIKRVHDGLVRKLRTKWTGATLPHLC
jgi:hypothetical protein